MEVLGAITSAVLIKCAVVGAGLASICFWKQKYIKEHAGIIPVGVTILGAVGLLWYIWQGRDKKKPKTDGDVSEAVADDHSPLHAFPSRRDDLKEIEEDDLENQLDQSTTSPNADDVNKSDESKCFGESSADSHGKFLKECAEVFRRTEPSFAQSSRVEDIVGPSPAIVLGNEIFKSLSAEVIKEEFEAATKSLYRSIREGTKSEGSGSNSEKESTIQSSQFFMDWSIRRAEMDKDIAEIKQEGKKYGTLC